MNRDYYLDNYKHFKSKINKISNLDEIMHKKHFYISHQLFELACDCRDREREILLRIEKTKLRKNKLKRIWKQ